MKYIHTARAFLLLCATASISLLSMEHNKSVVNNNNPIIALTNNAFILSAKKAYAEIGAKNFATLKNHISLLRGLRAIDMHDEEALARYVHKPELTYADRFGLIEAAKVFSELTNDNSYEKAVRGFFDKKGGDGADFQYAIAQFLVAGEQHYKCIKRYVYGKDLRIDKIIAQNNDTVTALLSNWTKHNNTYSIDYFLQDFSLTTGARSEPKPISKDQAHLASHNFDISTLSEQEATNTVQFLDAHHMKHCKAKKIPMSDNYVLPMQNGWIRIVNPLSTTIVSTIKEPYSTWAMGKDGTLLVANENSIIVIDKQGEIQGEKPLKTTIPFDRILCFENGTVGHVESNNCIKIYDATMQKCIWENKTGYYPYVETTPSGFMYWNDDNLSQMTVVDAKTLSTRIISLPSPPSATFVSTLNTSGIRMRNLSTVLYDTQGNFKQIMPPLDYNATKLYRLSDDAIYRTTTAMTKHGFTTRSGEIGDAGWTTMIHLFKATPLKVRDLEEVSFWQNKFCTDQHLLLDKINTAQHNNSYTFSSHDEENVFKKIPASIQNNVRKSIKLITRLDLLTEQHQHFTDCSVQ